MSNCKILGRASSSAMGMCRMLVIHTSIEHMRSLMGDYDFSRYFDLIPLELKGNIVLIATPDATLALSRIGTLCKETVWNAYSSFRKLREIIRGGTEILRTFDTTGIPDRAGNTFRPALIVDEKVQSLASRRITPFVAPVNDMRVGDFVFRDGDYVILGDYAYIFRNGIFNESFLYADKDAKFSISSKADKASDELSRGDDELIDRYLESFRKSS